MTSSRLGPSGYNLSFHIYARENCKTMAGVLTQFHGGKLRPCAFFSKVMPVSVQGMSACLRSLAACAIMVELVTSLTLGHHTTLYTTHDVVGLLRGVHTQHMSAQRLSGLLLSDPSLQIKNVPHAAAHVLNALIGLKGGEDILLDKHDCLKVLEYEATPPHTRGICFWVLLAPTCRSHAICDSVRGEAS